jgi:hypothetical protein
MKVVVVYESLWGNTAAIAKAIAEGIGPETRALTTDEAAGAEIAGVDLIVAGAPVIAFGLLSERSRDSVRANPGKAPSPPELSHPLLRSWLERLPKGHGRAAAFETGLWWSPGGASSVIMKGLERAGYRPFTKPIRFSVKGKYGPLREGELERARLWGAKLAKAME